MTIRRYEDDEVRKIFSLATTGDVRDPTPRAESGALTLAEIQRIGQEVGIEPARVAEAAQALEARGRVAPVRRSFGVPVGLSRIVGLPRAPTDREWEQLISEFRTTFEGLGSEATSGGLRQISLAAFVTNRIWLARWAREREAQMEALSERAVKLLSAPEVPRPR
jgi:hypothetical protein